MKISREDQIEFAKEILALENNTPDIEQLIHLKKLVSLLNGWTGGRSGVVGYLDEYLHEVIAIANGGEDTGWKDEFKKKLDAELEIA